MSNIHGLASLNNNRNNSDDDNSDENNNRYVGGVSSRGGGSGLAVEPNTNETNNDILGTIRSNAEEAQPSSSSSPSSSTNRRVITMYRSGFTIDNGPFRRLDDPSNAGFLRDLARGVTPRELYESSGSNEQDMEVGLVDKRHMDYEDDTNTSTNAFSSATTTAPAAFTGEGQSLGGGSNPTSTDGGVITPSSTSASASTAPPINESEPTTTIQIRLLNGQRLRIKCNTNDTIQTLVLHIEASGQAGTDDYVLSSGYPPKVLTDLTKSIEECGLKGAQVVQKKA